MVKVKICGITNSDDAAHASHAGADALGFIFTPKSPRCITRVQARMMRECLDPFITKVGVFLNQPEEEVFAIAREVGLNCVQLHGDESPAYSKVFRKEFRVIKVLCAQDRPFAEKIKKYKAHAYLFDIKFDYKKPGQVLPAEITREIVALSRDERVIVASGLTPDTVAAAARLGVYGVDVASGVESMVGKKDHDKVRMFIENAKLVSRV